MNANSDTCKSDEMRSSTSVSEKSFSKFTSRDQRCRGTQFQRSVRHERFRRKVHASCQNGSKSRLYVRMQCNSSCCDDL